MTKGTLKILRDAKGQPRYQAVYSNKNNKEVTQNISLAAICFEEKLASDGAAITIELTRDYGLAKVVLDGHPEKRPAVAPQSSPPAGRPGGGSPRSYAGGNSSGASNRTPRPSAFDRGLWATAPYNFIPFDEKICVPGAEPGSGEAAYGGVITCRLEALTPLLVAGPQKRDEDKERRFLEVGGRPVIPGSSIKGLLRSLIEVMSFSGLRPLNDRKLFFRNFDDENYRRILGTRGAERQKAGWLTRRGAEYFIHPAEYSRDQRAADWKPVETGRPVKGTSNLYYFGPAGDKELRVDIEKINQFREQLTKAQEDILKKRGAEPALNLKKPLPVFYVADDQGQPAFLGLPKYFRYPYEKKPADLAGQSSGRNFAAALFGQAEGEAQRGRVAVSAAELEGGELASPDGFLATLGQPQPTCLAHYLRQDPKKLLVMSNNSGRVDPKTFISYNSPDPRLAGRKWYWHRDWRPAENPQGNDNTNNRLYPLKAGTRGSFDVILDGVSLAELGAALLALELPAGAAHKLGLGKPLGLGSVRVTVEKCRLWPEKERYGSLAARLSGPGEEAEEPFKAKAKEAFKNHVLQAFKNYGDFEDLPAIKALRAMMDFDGRPDNQDTAYMDLQGDKGYRRGAPLKDPLAIMAGGRSKPA